jgi:uncharacterized protein YecE (DUF72 family)
MSPHLQYHIGCSGWSYSAWQGPFYPLNLENSRWLSYYSHVFDYVEIDSSFYRIPNVFMVKNWCKKTPNHFRFTAKFPKVITHDKRLKLTFLLFIYDLNIETVRIQEDIIIKGKA